MCIMDIEVAYEDEIRKDRDKGENIRWEGAFCVGLSVPLSF